jgi:hypothetical protein
VSRKTSSVAAGAAALFLLLHLPYLPKSLEDVDSINFAMGVRHFDVAHHQPHPPGYPVFVALAKGLHAAGLSEVHALALLSVIAGSIGVVALLALFVAIDRRSTSDTPAVTKPPLRAYGATLLAVSAPLYWFTASRPLSDAAGLTAAVAVQALIVSATSDRELVAAGFLSAFATGLRSQVAWLTVPLLVFVIWRRTQAGKPSIALATVGAFIVGGFAWGMPLVMLTGGPAGYWHALANQGNEDLTNIVMLWTTHTLHEARLSLYYALVAPWAVPVLAGAVLVSTLAGLGAAWRRSRNALVLLAVAFGPYLLFDLVFQETITTRYALPLVVPVAYLAACGAALAGPSVAIAAVGAAAVFGMHVGGTSVAAYASQPAPAFRLLDGMRSEASIARTTQAGPNGSAANEPVLAMHRREDFDLRRPTTWAGIPPLARRLPAPPKHEWMEVVKYWNAGGRDPVWFVADPLRSDLALFGMRDAPEEYRWTLEYPVLLGGTRPSEMDWYAIPLPDWYLGEGWALTPETAGVAMEDRRGPGYAAIDGWIRRSPASTAMMVGGRNLAPGGPAAHVRIAVDGRTADEADIAPGFFLRVIDVPPTERTGVGGYAHVTVSASAADVAIEQFDAQPAGRIVMGFGEGWHEREYNPATGRLWRWTSDRAVLRLRTPSQALVLDLEGEVEAARASRVTIRVGDRILAARDVGAVFAIRQQIPRNLVKDGDNTITISTDQTYVPAERRRGTADRRLLGLRVFRCRVTPAF